MKHLLLALLGISTACSNIIAEWSPLKSQFENSDLKPSGKALETPEFDTNGNLIFANKQHLILPEETAKNLPKQNIAYRGSSSHRSIPKVGLDRQL